MRNIVFIARPGCASCLNLMEKVIAPLKERYPHNVSVHYKWDSTVERVNRRKTITSIPLIVAEHDGREDFRYCGRLGIDELEQVILCERETLALGDVIDEAVA